MKRLLLVCGVFLFAAHAATAATPIGIVTGQDRGWPDVRAWGPTGLPARGDAPWGAFNIQFSPYSTYQNGVQVAVGDFRGTGRNDIVTAPGPGGFTELRLFDGKSYSLVRTLPLYKDAAWWNGAFVSAGDVNGDGRADVVDGLENGCCTQVHAVDATTGQELAGFSPFGNDSGVGARVAAGDFDGGGKAELAVLAQGTARSVQVFGPTGGAAVRTVDLFDADATSGAAIAAGKLLGSARDLLVAAASTPAGLQVRVLDLRAGTTLATYAPLGATQTQQPQVAVGDVNGDGRADIVLVAPVADGTKIVSLDTSGTLLGAFYVLDPGLAPGTSLAAGDLDGDKRAEIVLGGGASNAPWPPDSNGPDPRVGIFRADGTRVGSFGAYPGLFQGGVRVALGDLTGDRVPELVTAPGPGMDPEIDVFSRDWVNGRDRGTRLAHWDAYDAAFRGGVDVAVGYGDVVTGAGPGHTPEVRVFTRDGRLVASWLAFDATYTGGISVGTGDVDGDGKADVVAGTLAPPARIRAFSLEGVPLGPVAAPFAPDAPGVNVAIADLSGSGHGVVLAAPVSGSDAAIAFVDPRLGTILRTFVPFTGVDGGLRIAAGDLDSDGRDEIVAAPGWGGDGVARIFGPGLKLRSLVDVYTWQGAGMNVAAPARVGLPIAAETRSVAFKARVRVRTTIARFRDAAASAVGLRATITWGDSSTSTGTVVQRPRGVYDVVATKRYLHRGRFPLIVTLTDAAGRISIARNAAVVR